MLKNEHGKKTLINKTNILNGVAILIDSLIIISSFKNAIISFIIYIVSLIFWVYLIIYF